MTTQRKAGDGRRRGQACREAETGGFPCRCRFSAFLVRALAVVSLFVVVVCVARFGNWLLLPHSPFRTMKLNFANPVSGSQKVIDVEDETVLCVTISMHRPA